MPYDVAAGAYASRVRALLDICDEPHLLYAALELRSGVEARMKEYLDPLEHIPKSQKKDYSIVKLGRSVDSAFTLVDHIAVFTFRFSAEDGEVSLRYIPISRRLQDIVSKLGDALHFPGEANANDTVWWSRLRELVEEGYAWFAFAATGDLMGIPLLDRRTKQTSMRVIVANGDPRWKSLQRLKKGAKHVVRISYEPLPPIPPAFIEAT